MMVMMMMTTTVRRKSPWSEHDGVVRRIQMMLAIWFWIFHCHFFMVAGFVSSVPFPRENMRFHTIIGSGHSSKDSFQHQATSTQNFEVTATAIAFQPPPPLQSLRVGESISAFRQQRQANDNSTRSIQNFTVVRVSEDPPMFHLQNILSHSECQEIKQQAIVEGLGTAETFTDGDKSSRTHCEVSWLPSSPIVVPMTDHRPTSAEEQKKTHIPGDLAISLGRLFLQRPFFHHPQSGVEDLQVVHYKTGGEFVLHHDTGPQTPRVLTILYYLNHHGGTWFPLATTTRQKLHPQDKQNDGSVPQNIVPQSKGEALQACQDLCPGRDGLVVVGKEDDPTYWLKEFGGTNSPENKSNNHRMKKTTMSSSSSMEKMVQVQPGDAIAFYNYCCPDYDNGGNDDTINATTGQDQESIGRLNWKAIHAGLPVQKDDDRGSELGRDIPVREKWIANHWFRYGGALESPPSL